VGEYLEVRHGGRKGPVRRWFASDRVELARLL
jgi:hypothetical protein